MTRTDDLPMFAGAYRNLTKLLRPIAPEPPKGNQDEARLRLVAVRRGFDRLMRERA